MDNALIDQPAELRPDASSRGPETQSAAPSSRPRAIDVRWLVMICLLLGASGALRYWRDFQFASLASQSKESPFPLKEIPPKLGNWRMIEGAEVTLDPQIARIAGSSDHVLRKYENAATGEKSTVLVLYGPSQLVWGHTPEVCYPTSGYKVVEPPRDLEIPNKSGGSPPFREGLYGMFKGGAATYHEAFYSFLNGGVWTPNMEPRWKQFRYNPGMFKIQVERQLKDVGARDEACNDLLAALVEEIELRSKATASR